MTQEGITHYKLARSNEREVVSAVRSYRLDGTRRRSESRPSEGKQTNPTPMTRMDLKRKVWVAKRLGIVPRTRTVNISHWAYWVKLCNLWEVDMMRFGSLPANSEEAISLRLKGELD